MLYKGVMAMLAASLVVTAVDSAALAQSETVEIVNYNAERSAATVQPVLLNGEHKALAVVFEGTDDLHYYARSETAPAPNLQLQIGARAADVQFGDPLFPEWDMFYDPGFQKDVEVYVGDFTIYVPIEGEAPAEFDAAVVIKGIACTSEICLSPFTKTIDMHANFAKAASVSVDAATLQARPALALEPPAQAREDIEPTDETAEPGDADEGAPLAQRLAGYRDVVAGEEDAVARGVAFYFVLAVLAGISINIMPCVLPVLPLIIMRLVSQAKESSGRRIALGLSFCGGIILFFAAFAVISAVIYLTTGAVIDLNSLFRQPTAVIVLFLLIVFFALVFLDVVTIALPSSMTSQPSGGGFAGSIGMGFFAGILSTPCSGALLGAVLVWAQTQTLAVSSTAIILMGVGMALPYAILISIPKLLDFVPKPGTWMEIFKKAGGFLLLLIAVKFTLTALTKERLINVALYGVIFAFCVWMWGKWVGYSTPAARKWTVRGLAVILAVLAGFYFLPEPEPSKIAWNQYDPSIVEEALQDDRPVVIKFTADWCTNCKVVDRRVYQDPDIARLIEREDLVPIKADTTQEDYPAAVALKTIFGEAGNVPVTVILNPQEETMIKLRGIFSPEEFVDVVDRLR